MTKDLILDALKMAIQRRKPDKGLLFFPIEEASTQTMTSRSSSGIMGLDHR